MIVVVTPFVKLKQLWVFWYVLVGVIGEDLGEVKLSVLAGDLKIVVVGVILVIEKRQKRTQNRQYTEF